MMRRIQALQLAFVLVMLTGCSLFVPAEKPDGNQRSLLFWMPGAASVQVLADWNEWGGYVSAGGVVNPTTGAMERLDNGFWSYDLRGLEPGIYRYAFLINGYRWTSDPQNPETAVFQERTVSLLFVGN